MSGNKHEIDVQSRIGLFWLFESCKLSFLFSFSLSSNDEDMSYQLKNVDMSQHHRNKPNTHQSAFTCLFILHISLPPNENTSHTFPQIHHPSAGGAASSARWIQNAILPYFYISAVCILCIVCINCLRVEYLPF